MKLNKIFYTGMVSVALSTVIGAQAATFTSNSPTGLDVTTVGASTVGGIVVDLLGTNNTHVVSQLAASSLFIGYSDDGTPVANRGNPFTIGTQTGFSAAVTGALGGGLQSASVRFTLWDGDSASGNFDFNNLTLLLNGVSSGNWSTVNALNTDGLGVQLAGGLSSGGFRNNTLDTGWFHVTDSTTLSSIFTSITGTQQLVFQTLDDDPADNYYDFTQGINASLLDVGQGPGVVPTNPVPEPETYAMMLAGLGLIGFTARRRKAKQA